MRPGVQAQDNVVGTGDEALRGKVAVVTVRVKPEDSQAWLTWELREIVRELVGGASQNAAAREMSAPKYSKARLMGSVAVLSCFPIITIAALFLWEVFAPHSPFRDHWFWDSTYPILTLIPLVTGTLFTQSDRIRSVSGITTEACALAFPRRREEDCAREGG